MSERPAPYRTARGGDRSSQHSQLLRAIVQFIAWHGGHVQRVPGGVMTHDAPDIIAAIRGRCVCVDGKTGKAVLTKGQEEQRVLWERAGALYIVARQVEDVEDALLAAGLIDAPAIVAGGRRQEP
jgi:Holliday junction resolvase